MKTYMKCVATLLGLLFMGTASAFDLSIRSFYAGAGAGYATSDAVCDYSATNRVAPSSRTGLPQVNENRLARHLFTSRLEEIGDGAPGQFLGTITGFGSTNVAGGQDGVIELGFSDPDPASLNRNCDDSDVSWKVFGGMKFGDYFGLEAGYADFGETSATVSSGEFELRSIFVDVDGDGDVDGNFRPGASPAPVNGSVSVEGEQDTVFFAGLLRYNIMDNFEIFLKGGAHYWEVEMNATGTYRIGHETNPYTYVGRGGGGVDSDGTGPGPAPTGSIEIPAGVTTVSGDISTIRVDDDGFDPFFGIGLGYTMDNGLGFRAEWERYYFDIDLPQTSSNDPNFYRREIEDEVDVFTLSVLYHFSL